MSAITAKASRKMKKYAVLTREPRCFLGSFDFSWEQRKLSEMCGTFEYGLNAAAKEFDGKNKYIRITDIDDASREFLLSDLSSPDICLDGMSKYLLSSGDIVFARTGASVGKTYIYRENDGIVYFAGFLIRAKVNQDNDAEFVFQSTLSPSYEKYIRITSQRSGQPGVNAQEYGEYDLFAPSKEEQQRIGHFLRGIDNLITLHQRKCANLCSPSQVVFSLLFATSTFSWEQRKLGELALFNPKDELPQTFEYVDLESVVGTEMLSHRTEVKSSAPSRAQRLAHTGDLFYQTVRPYQKNNYLFEKPDNNYVFSTGYAQMRPYVDGYFLLSLVQSERFVKVVLDNCTGTSYPAINANDLAEIEVAAPSDESEAQKIGTIFRSIDNLITLHQRECISFTGRADRLILTANKKRTTSSWEQRKLGDVVKEITRNDPESEAPIMMITANNGFIEQSERYAFNNAGESLKKYILLKKGELAYNHGASKLRPYGSCFALTTAENARIPFVYHCFSAENQNAEFMSIELNGAEIENQLRKIVSSGARMDGLLNISFDEYTSVSVLLPGTEEQDRIADFFRHLDNLITLHQRKPFLMKWRTSDANRNQTNRLVL